MFFNEHLHFSCKSFARIIFFSKIKNKIILLLSKSNKMKKTFKNSFKLNEIKIVTAFFSVQ